MARTCVTSAHGIASGRDGGRARATIRTRRRPGGRRGLRGGRGRGDVEDVAGRGRGRARARAARSPRADGRALPSCSRRVARAVADELRLDALDATEVELVAVLHDVGKLAIDPALLDFPGRLSDAQLERMRRHTIEGEELLAETAGLDQLAPAVRATHEAWDGSGYPDGLSGDEIPLTARIVAVVDAYDAMISERPYRTALPRPRGDRGACAPARACSSTRAWSRRCCACSFASGARSMIVCPSCPRSRSPRAGSTPRCAARRRVRPRAGPERAQDVRPAAGGARGTRRRRRAPARQAPRRRPRRRPRAARAPDVRRAPAALRHARLAARSDLAPARAPGRRARAAPARVRHEAGARGSSSCRPAPSRTTTRSRRSDPRRGPSRRRCASCWPSTGRARCTRCCATSA